MNQKQQTRRAVANSLPKRGCRDTEPVGTVAFVSDGDGIPAFPSPFN